MKASPTKELALALLELTENPSATQADVQKSVKDFAAYLNKKGLLGEASKIIEEYSKLYNKKNGIVEATVTLAERLPEKTRLELAEALKKKYKVREIHIQEKVDQRIIGGMKVRVGDEVYDASIQNWLKKLQTQLLK